MGKMKKYKNKLKSSSNLVAFDCTKNGDDFNPLYHPRTYPRAWMSCHISDDCMRNILHLALVDMGMENCTNEELCKWMIEQGIYDESQASAWVLQYIANKEVNNNVERD